MSERPIITVDIPIDSLLTGDLDRVIDNLRGLRTKYGRNKPAVMRVSGGSYVLNFAKRQTVREAATQRRANEARIREELGYAAADAASLEKASRKP